MCGSTDRLPGSAPGLKLRLKTGKPLIGCFVDLYAPKVAERLSRDNFDFIILDAEHGLFSREEIENMIRACDVSGMPVIVRVDYDPSTVQKVLDMGADGILVPMIRTVEDVRGAVKRAKYPPMGSRGSDFYSRAYRYGRNDPRGFLRAQNEDTLVIAQIETPEAVAALDGIMAEQGVDGIFIGAMDLSVSMGEAGPSTPSMQKVIRKIYDKARTAGMPTGAVFVNRDTYESAAAQGAVLLSTTIMACLDTGIRELLEETK